MIMDMITYLLRNMAMFEVEGIKSKSDEALEKFFDKLDAEKERMIRPIMEEFFIRLEQQKEAALRQFGKLSIFVSGIFLTSVGVAYIIDEIVSFPGVGFVAVGVIVLLSSFLLKNR